jgi:tRNA threonylcarbamoyladenosine biosynthesis protein TsaB
VALARDGEIVNHQQSSGDWKHSREITLLIQACLDSATRSVSDISAVAVSSGPGSYTGLRVGTSAAKGMCFSLNIPLISVDTLKIMAYPFVQDLPEDGYVIPLIDARRQEVYYNVYNKALEAQEATNNLVLSQDSFMGYAGKNTTICGDGAEKAAEFLDRKLFRIVPSLSLAKNMCALSFGAYKKGNFENLAYFSPFYLKPPNITKSKKPLF